MQHGHAADSGVGGYGGGDGHGGDGDGHGGDGGGGGGQCGDTVEACNSELGCRVSLQPRSIVLAQAKAAYAASVAAEARAGERNAYMERVSLLQRQPAAHPVERFRGLVNLQLLRLSLRMSTAEFDEHVAGLEANVASWAQGRGSLDVKTRAIADTWHLEHCRALGLELKPKTLRPWDGVRHASGQRDRLDVPGFFVDWIGVAKFCAENPLHYNRQRVEAAKVTVGGERFYEHAVSGNAYLEAMEHEKLKRQEVEYDYRVYSFYVFQDKASEPNGESVMMFFAVSCHLLLDDQCNPANWLCVGVAGVLRYPTVRERELPSSVRARASLEDEYTAASVGKLLAAGEQTVEVMQSWAGHQRKPAVAQLIPALHKWLLDDPQQHASLAVVGCAFCMQRNARRACRSESVADRTVINSCLPVDEALEILELHPSSHDVEHRVAKAKLRQLGLPWPPRRNPVLDAPVKTHPFRVSAFMPMHNFGLCVAPDCMQMALNVIYHKVFGSDPIAWTRWLRAADEYARAEFASYHILKGRGRKNGLISGILKKRKGPPVVRGGCRYDIIHTLRCFRVIIHPTLVRASPTAARALQRMMELGRLLLQKGLLESERGALKAKGIELMPLVKAASSLDAEMTKDYNRSPNWHKSTRHASDLFMDGPFYGGGNDEHAEFMQKLMHQAYRCFSDKKHVVQNIANFLMRRASQVQTDGWLAASNADLVLAATYGIADHVRLLLRFADPLTKDKTTNRCPGVDALSAACKRGHTACMRLLLDSRVDVDARDADGKTLLIASACAGHLASAKLLVESRASPQLTWSRLNALEWAQYSRHPDVAALLSSAGLQSRQGDLNPTPRMNRFITRLRPPLGGERRRCYLDLTSLRNARADASAEVRTARQQNRRNCPDLADHLEYALRVSACMHVTALVLLLSTRSHHCRGPRLLCVRQVYLNGGNEDVPMAQLPKLHGESLIVEVRPGIILRPPESVGHDAREYDIEAMLEGLAPVSRLLKTRRVSLPTYTVSETGEPRRASHRPNFLSICHCDPDYDVYAAEHLIDLIFTKPSGEEVPLVFVRWMDDAPRQENIGPLVVPGDPPNDADTWEALEARIRGDRDCHREDADSDDTDRDDSDGGDSGSDGNVSEDESMVDEWDRHEDDQDGAPAKRRRPPPPIDDGGDDCESGSDDNSAGGGDVDSDEDGHSQGGDDSIRMHGGICFRRFIYAVRTQNSTVLVQDSGGNHHRRKRQKKRPTSIRTAAAHWQGKAFYSICELAELSSDINLVKPYFHHDEVWDPEKKPLTSRGYWLFNADMSI